MNTQVLYQDIKALCADIMSGIAAFYRRHVAALFEHLSQEFRATLRADLLAAEQEATTREAALKADLATDRAQFANELATLREELKAEVSRLTTAHDQFDAWASRAIASKYGPSVSRKS